jgi:hypothetical protein
MLGLRSGFVAVLALLLCASVAGAAPNYQPGSPPSACAGDGLADQIGTDRSDRLTAPTRAERLWGLGGPDRLTGSSTRATCLFGGRDGDVLDLAAGGGMAWGEAGGDTILGGPLADTLNGGPGVDAFAAGAGDDLIQARDGNAEVVDCGPGHDLVDADRSDLLIGCEVAVLSGRSTPSLTPEPRAAATSAIVRVRFTVPRAARAGAYRVLLTTGARSAGCANGPLELTRLPMPGHAVRAGQVVRIGLRPPAGGWCSGVERAAIVLHPACAKGARCLVAPPAEPVARLRFSAG